MSIKKVFHLLPSEIAANVHGQYGTSRLDWPHKLAAISECQKWKTFLMLILLHMDIEVQKSALPTLFDFARVRAASQPVAHLLTYLTFAPNLLPVGMIFGRTIHFLGAS